VVQQNSGFAYLILLRKRTPIIKNYCKTARTSIWKKLMQEKKLVSIILLSPEKNLNEVSQKKCTKNNHNTVT